MSISLPRDFSLRFCITDEQGTELSDAQVFVVVPYAQEFRSKKLSTLLVNKGIAKPARNNLGFNYRLAEEK